MKIEQEWLDFLREQYPAGSRIRLTKMGNAPHPIPPGSMGTLDHIDDAGQFQIKIHSGPPVLRGDACVVIIAEAGEEICSFRNILHTRFL